MGDLAAALREAGHGDVADALEKKELAGRLRQSGRDDLANQLEAGGETSPAGDEDTPPSVQPTPPAPHEQLAQQLNAAQSKWLTLGGPEGSDDAEAA
jgi:hypothetical protein